jgi:sigma-B regulation protein RsbU (phosphoserine phosphatase)
MGFPDLSSVPGDRFSLLFRLTQTFTSSLDLNEVLNRVMDEVIATIQAERGFVMLVGEDGNLNFRAARGFDHHDIQSPEFEISRGTVQRVAQEGEPILTSDAQMDEWFSGRQSVQNLKLRSVMCTPLKVKDRVTGVIYVDNRIKANVFTSSDLDLLGAIASVAAIAIENARLYQISIKEARMEQELLTARQMQISLLPGEVPQIPGWDFAAFWKPAREVAGDFYDFIPLPDGKLGLVMADVCDKGMAAALFMAVSRSILRASLGNSSTPADDISHANRSICGDSNMGYFVTLFYALLDPASGVFTYVNAGHNPPLLYQSSSKSNPITPIELTRTGIALGADARLPYQQKTIQLDPGDFIFLYTDGITEAEDQAGQAFGLLRLQKILQEHVSESAAEIISRVERNVTEFTASTTPFDDITLMVVRRL